MNFLMFKLVLEKAEEPEIKLPTSTDVNQIITAKCKTAKALRGKIDDVSDRAHNWEMCHG